MTKLAGRQPLLLGFLAVVLGVVLYTSISTSDEAVPETGFDEPVNVGFVEPQPVHPAIDDWTPPAVQRNPFVGPNRLADPGEDIDGESVNDELHVPSSLGSE